MKFSLYDHQVTALDRLRQTIADDQTSVVIDGEQLVRIRGFERYWVGGRGSVFSLIRAGRQLAPTTSPQGYPYVALMKVGAAKGEKLLVHRLVATAFVPNPMSLDVVNHINGDKEDPRAANLEWVTFAENNDHARRTGLSTAFGATHYAAKLTDEVVQQIRTRAAGGETHRQIAAAAGVARQTVTKIVGEKAWRSAL